MLINAIRPTCNAEPIFRNAPEISNMSKKIQLPILNFFKWEKSKNWFEIENGKISLIKWLIDTNDDGVLQIVKEYIETPQNLSEYK